VFARFASTSLTFGEVQAVVLRIFRNLSVLLASLSPVVYFLARVIEQPATDRELGEYPLFLGINVFLIALCGCVAVVRQASTLFTGQGLSLPKAWALITAWLLLSLLVGAQWAWYLRPFFGVSALEEDTPFCLGTSPDFRGATSFYEAVHDIFNPPR
jgi:hypothetical protein